MVQIKQKRGIGVENPSARSFSGGFSLPLSWTTQPFYPPKTVICIPHMSPPLLCLPHKSPSLLRLPPSLLDNMSKRDRCSSLRRQESYFSFPLSSTLIHMCAMTHSYEWDKSHTSPSLSLQHYRHATLRRQSCLFVFHSGVATISRLLKIIGFFCERTLWKRLYSAEETYNFKEPANCSHPIQTLQPPQTVMSVWLSPVSVEDIPTDTWTDILRRESSMTILGVDILNV